jgi:hypothetical protein
MVHLEKLELSAAWVCVHIRIKGQFDRINPSLNPNLEGDLIPNERLVMKSFIRRVIPQIVTDSLQSVEPKTRGAGLVESGC